MDRADAFVKAQGGTPDEAEAAAILDEAAQQLNAVRAPSTPPDLAVADEVENTLRADIASKVESGEASPEDAAAAGALVDDIIAKLRSGEMQLPDEPNVEAEPEVLWFKCKYGHIQQGDYYYQVRNPNTGEITWRTPPMCTRCQAQWLANKFPTRRIPAPTSSKQ